MNSKSKFPGFPRTMAEFPIQLPLNSVDSSLPVVYASYLSVTGSPQECFLNFYSASLPDNQSQPREGEQAQESSHSAPANLVASIAISTSNLKSFVQKMNSVLDFDELDNDPEWQELRALMPSDEAFDRHAKPYSQWKPVE